MNSLGKIILPCVSWVYFSLFLMVAWEPLALPVVLLVVGLIVLLFLLRERVRVVRKDWLELRQRQRGDRVPLQSDPSLAVTPPPEAERPPRRLIAQTTRPGESGWIVT
mmetsp:Transcript_2130/g.5846  ORF Transcript_2130/g.5846 Transcript_2130/m.5846 type:complete len:108 (+) Transcript_2130:73-396(+)